MSSGSTLPDVAEVLRPILERVPREQQPLLIALAERMAAERYRGWAEAVARPDRKSALLACADREEEIARRVEALYSTAASTRRELLAGNPDLVEINRSLFAPYSLDEQFKLQAQGERVGAATWRAFARHQGNAQAHETFLSCALLEEDNAAFLESISMSEENVPGSCFCGAIRFSVRLPTIFCGHCHCSMCRRSHGAGYVTWLAVPRGQFELESGESELARFGSSDHGTRSFCKRCGSSLFCESSHYPDIVDIVLANMHGPIDRQPECHVYFDDRADWVVIDDALPRLGGSTGREPTTGGGR